LRKMEEEEFSIKPQKELDRLEEARKSEKKAKKEKKKRKSEDSSSDEEEEPAVKKKRKKGGLLFKDGTKLGGNKVKTKKKKKKQKDFHVKAGDAPDLPTENTSGMNIVGGSYGGGIQSTFNKDYIRNGKTYAASSTKALDKREKKKADRYCK